MNGGSGSAFIVISVIMPSPEEVVFATIIFFLILFAILECKNILCGQAYSNSRCQLKDFFLETFHGVRED